MGIRIPLGEIVINRKIDIEKVVEIFESEARLRFKGEFISLIDILFNVEAKKFYENEWRTAADIYYYSHYSPIYYDRTTDLYNAAEYKIFSAKDLEVGLDVSPKNMNGGHRASNDFIYQHMYNEGWHGGAWGSKTHPNYWRTPYEVYRSWGRPAIQSGGDIEKMKKYAEDKAGKKVKNRLIFIPKKFGKKIIDLSNEVIKDVLNNL